MSDPHMQPKRAGSAADGPSADGGLPIPLAQQPVRGAVTWRSVLLGCVSVIVICGLAPFNDYVVANSYLVGSHLPPFVVVWMMALTVLLNGVLHRWWPKQALAAGELAVVLAMMLIACAVPTTGTMRFLLPQLVAPFHFGVTNPSFWSTFVALDLPDWLFPVESIEQGRNSPIVTGFYNRMQDGRVPYGAWVIPLAGWGVFVGAMSAGMIALAALVRHQWAVNERLAFPLAQLQLSLIEAPRPGRMLNELLGSRLFWFSLLSVVCIHSVNAFHQYFPKNVPEIPLRFDLTNVLSNEPWVYLHWSVKRAGVFFTFIGIAYFIQSRISFSLWSLFLLAQVASVQQRMVQSETSLAAWRDQHLGSAVVMLLAILWIGRHRWATILRQMIGIRRPGEKTSDFASYRMAGWVLVVCLAIMLGWLAFMGVQLWVAVLIVAFILLAHILTSRIVAEVGIPFLRMDASVGQIQANLSPALLRGQDVYFSGVFTVNGVVTSRESLMSFGLHGMQVAAATEDTKGRHRTILGLMVGAMLLGVIVSVISSLWCYYNYATPITPQIQTVINNNALELRPKMDLVDPLESWRTQHRIHQPHNSWLHMGIGAGITALLQTASLRWAAWPLAPVGYLLCSSWYMQVPWLSLLIGWALKVLILRYGGSRLFQQARPLFVGLVFGEAMAAGLWLMINLALAGFGYDYRQIMLFPA